MGGMDAEDGIGEEVEKEKRKQRKMENLRKCEKEKRG